MFGKNFMNGSFRKYQIECQNQYQKLYLSSKMFMCVLKMKKINEK